MSAPIIDVGSGQAAATGLGLMQHFLQQQQAQEQFAQQQQMQQQHLRLQELSQLLAAHNANRQDAEFQQKTAEYNARMMKDSAAAQADAAMAESLGLVPAQQSNEQVQQQQRSFFETGQGEMPQTGGRSPRDIFADMPEATRRGMIEEKQKANVKSSQDAMLQQKRDDRYMRRMMVLDQLLADSKLTREEYLQQRDKAQALKEGLSDPGDINTTGPINTPEDVQSALDQLNTPGSRAVGTMLKMGVKPTASAIVNAYAQPKEGTIAQNPGVIVAGKERDEVLFRREESLRELRDARQMNLDMATDPMSVKKWKELQQSVRSIEAEYQGKHDAWRKAIEAASIHHGRDPSQVQRTTDAPVSTGGEAGEDTSVVTYDEWAQENEQRTGTSAEKPQQRGSSASVPFVNRRTIGTPQSVFTQTRPQPRVPSGPTTGPMAAGRVMPGDPDFKQPPAGGQLYRNSRGKLFLVTQDHILRIAKNIPGIDALAKTDPTAAYRKIEDVLTNSIEIGE